MNWLELSLVSKIREKQVDDPILHELKKNVHKRKVIAFARM